MTKNKKDKLIEAREKLANHLQSRQGISITFSEILTANMLVEGFTQGEIKAFRMFCLCMDNNRETIVSNSTIAALCGVHEKNLEKAIRKLVAGKRIVRLPLSNQKILSKLNSPLSPGQRKLYESLLVRTDRRPVMSLINCYQGEVLYTSQAAFLTPGNGPENGGVKTTPNGGVKTTPLSDGLYSLTNNTRNFDINTTTTINPKNGREAEGEEFAGAKELPQCSSSRAKESDHIVDRIKRKVQSESEISSPPNQAPIALNWPQHFVPNPTDIPEVVEQKILAFELINQAGDKIKSNETPINHRAEIFSDIESKQFLDLDPVLRVLFFSQVGSQRARISRIGGLRLAEERLTHKPWNEAQLDYAISKGYPKFESHSEKIAPLADLESFSISDPSRANRIVSKLVQLCEAGGLSMETAVSRVEGYFEYQLSSLRELYAVLYSGDYLETAIQLTVSLWPLESIVSRTFQKETYNRNA